MIRRCDVSAVGADIRRTPSGGLVLTAHPTRAGVLVYRNPDGSERREYRPPEEVFSEESLASMAGAPVTHLHPDDFVTPDTWNALSKGHLGESPRRDGDKVSVKAHIQSRDAVKGVLDRKLVELSMGYTTDLDETPGITPDGERYDAVQRNIRYNHVALLPPGAGRAGPDVRLRMDSAYVSVAGMPTAETPAATPAPTPVPVERTDAAALVARADRLEGENATLRSRLDSLESEVKAEKARFDSALENAVTERLTLIEQVRPFSNGEDLSKLGTRALLEKGAGRADGSDDFLRGCLAVRTATKASSAVEALRNPVRVDSDDSPCPVAAARKAMIEGK